MWVYKSTRERWCDALLSRVGCFAFCKIAARWVYKSTRMTWRCVAIEWFDALFFCKIVARWVYKTHAWDDMAMRCYRRVWCFCSFVKSLQDGFTKTHAWDDMFTLRCFLVWCFVFCYLFARWGYKNTRISLIWQRCVAFGFGVYKNTRMRTEHGIPDFISFMRARNHVFWPKWGIKNRGIRALHEMTTMRCGFDALYFVNYLQDGVTKTHAWDDTTMRLLSRWMLCSFVK